MADKLFQDGENVTIRLACECLYPGHILDVSIDLADEGKRVSQCTLNLYMDGKAPLKYRLKQIWRLLQGEEGNLADFILRTEDVPEIIALLSRIAPTLPTSMEVKC